MMMMMMMVSEGESRSPKSNRFRSVWVAVDGAWSRREGVVGVMMIAIQ